MKLSMDALGAPVGPSECIDESEEEARVLLLADDVDDLACPRVERTGHVPLHVLAGSEDDELLAPAHVGGADPRVQVDVGLVEMEDLILGVSALHQAIDLIQ